MTTFDQCLSPDTPRIDGASKEYNEFAAQLSQISELLVKTGIERRLVQSAVGRATARAVKSQGWIARMEIAMAFQVRCSILRRLLGLDYRALSVMASDSALIQWFLRRGRVEGFVGAVLGNGLSKSALERYDKAIPVVDLEDAVRVLCAKVGSKSWTGKMSGLDEPLDVRNLYADCTCLGTDIHFPVDWVLLRDAVRTLVRAIIVLRKHGLRHRIRKPERFLTEINHLCMAMSAAGRGKNSKKKRKRTLRAMLKVVDCVKAHAVRYRDLLKKCRQTHTDLTEAEADQVLGRIDAVLERLPAAIEQVRQRMLKGGKVENSTKVLSLYEPETHVVVRGKSGAPVEFGNTLYIAESPDGLIVDFEFFRNRAPAESEILKGSLERCVRWYGAVESVTTDRGFSSEKSATACSDKGVTSYILPRSPRLMAEAMENESFRAAQKRRAQTEGRIGIVKNVFIGETLSGKGYDHQRIEVAWNILAHNLWVLARMAIRNLREERERDMMTESA